MPKVWLCGQFGTNSYEYIKDYITRLQWFDGGIFSINYSTKEDKIYDKVLPLVEYKLDQYQKEGECFYTRWSNQHHLSFSIILQCGLIKDGDWCCFLDAPELLKEEFAKDIKNKVREWDSKNIVAAGWNGKIFFFKWNDQLNCYFTPHQSFHGIQGGNYLELADESKVKYTEEGCHFGDFILNRRKLIDSHILHAIKYTFCYNISNQLQMFYQGEELQKHESGRKWFRYLFKQRGLEPTIENLKEFLQYCYNNKQFDPLIIEYFDYEPIYRDYFRLEILKTPLQEILDTRKSWSFKDYCSTLHP